MWVSPHTLEIPGVWLDDTILWLRCSYKTQTSITRLLTRHERLLQLHQLYSSWSETTVRVSIVVRGLPLVVVSEMSWLYVTKCLCLKYAKTSVLLDFNVGQMFSVVVRNIKTLRTTEQYYIFFCKNHTNVRKYKLRIQANISLALIHQKHHKYFVRSIQMYAKYKLTTQANISLALIQ